MNGSAGATFFTFGRPAAAAHLVTRWERLFAALMASCLLHMIAVVAPALGTSVTGGGAAPSALQGALPPGVLHLRIEEAGPPAARPAPANRAAPPVHGPAASRGVDVLPFPAHLYRFRTIDELTKHPRPRTKLRFNVPAPIFMPGKVILKVWIDAAGNVLGVDVEESSVPEALAAAAAAAFRDTSFTPGEIDGARVATLMRFEVTYADGVTFSYGKKNAPR